jgi:uncharacterized protein
MGCAQTGSGDTFMARELSDSELHRIDSLLSQVEGGAIPNTEALDGFFAALACCPDLIMPSEFLPVLQSGETEAGDLVFEDEDEARKFVELVMHHWSYVNERLRSGEIYFPLMIEDADGVALGNDWAKGFVTGTHLRGEIWAEVFEDEERGGPLVPIFALAYEDHPDQTMRPFEDPIDAEHREALIVGAAAGVMRLHAMFQSARADFLPDSNTFVHAAPKPGRNALCPCGSGKKFKKCCGAAPTFH